MQTIFGFSLFEDIAKVNQHLVRVRIFQTRIDETFSSWALLLDVLARLQKHFLYFGFNQQNVMTKNRSTTTDPIDTRPTLCRKLRLLLAQATASLLLLETKCSTANHILTRRIRNLSLW